MYSVFYFPAYNYYSHVDHFTAMYLHKLHNPCVLLHKNAHVLLSLCLFNACMYVCVRSCVHNHLKQLVVVFFFLFCNRVEVGLAVVKQMQASHWLLRGEEQAPPLRSFLPMAERFIIAKNSNWYYICWLGRDTEGLSGNSDSVRLAAGLNASVRRAPHFQKALKRIISVTSQPD